jgi:hypothetical protein
MTVDSTMTLPSVETVMVVRRSDDGRRCYGNLADKFSRSAQWHTYCAQPIAPKEQQPRTVIKQKKWARLRRRPMRVREVFQYNVSCFQYNLVDGR